MVGKSKVISGLNDWQAHRRRKDTIMGSSVGPDAWAQVREPKGTVGELFEPTFHAGLTNNDTARTPGGNFLPATVVRSTSATYVDKNGILQLAGINESRQEYANGQPLGTLIEPPSTNKNTNYNANPDAGLSNITTNLPPGVTLERVNDLAELRAAGLDVICSDGNVLKVDNSSGSATGYVAFGGETGNTNLHSASVYGRATAGSLQFYLRSDEADIVSTTSAAYVLLTSKSITPDATNRRLTIKIDVGSICYFILNQLEEQPVPTSTIITSGSSISRDADQLNWPLVDSEGHNILNQSQGMASLVWRPGFSNADVAGAGFASIRLLRLGTDDSQLMYFQKDLTSGENRFITWDGSEFTSVLIAAGLVADQDYLVAVRWTGAVKQIGYKTNGAWVWSVEDTYDGQWNAGSVLDLLFFTGTLNFPSRARNAYLWDEDRGTAYLESYFSGIAE